MKLSVVYLDDDLDLLEAFFELFSSAEVQIRIFSEPNQARAEILRDPPDLVFIDLHLETMSGDDFALQLDPGLPKVLLTGQQGFQPRAQYERMIIKPYRRPQILAVLEKYKQEKSFQ